MADPIILNRIKALGWFCAEGSFIDSDTRKSKPIFRIYDAQGTDTGAYGETEPMAWEAAVMLTKMRAVVKS